MTNDRRGKKEVTTSEPNDEITTRLDEAEAKMRQAQASAELLHQQWRTHLRRLSFLVTAISLHQAQSPMGACLKDIKALNQQYASNPPLSGMQASMAVLSDNACHMCAICMSLMLTYFLSADPPEGVSSRKYMAANVFLPAILTLFFTRTTNSCVDDLLLQAGMTAEPHVHSFPVAVVFHIIVTLSVWFMGLQAQKGQQNLDQIITIRKQMNVKIPKKKS